MSVRVQCGRGMRPYSQRFCDVAITLNFYCECDVETSLRIGPMHLMENFLLVTLGYVNSVHVPPPTEFFHSTKLFKLPKLPHTWLGQYFFLNLSMVGAVLTDRSCYLLNSADVYIAH